jgi:aminomethyltransferase
MVPFGGWEMPLSYPTGTLAEHRACREGAVVFDVSHLGTVRVEGPGAFEQLQRSLTNDLRRIEPGRAQYTHLLDEGDGSVVDDIIVWWRDEASFDVMPNASNTARVQDALRSTGCVVTDTTAERAVLAVQGPGARDRLAAIAPEAASVGRFRVQPLVWDGVEGTVAGTGYTGGDGVEVALPLSGAATLWDALLDADVVPAGLGARDTLRLEAGLPLHGQELGPGITPLNAGLEWVVGWDKEKFRGRDALLEQRSAPISPVLGGFRTFGRRPPRAGDEVLLAGERVGVVTSGNFSPMLTCGIALGYVDVPLDPGTEVELVRDSSAIAATAVALPFL